MLVPVEYSHYDSRNNTMTTGEDLSEFTAEALLVIVDRVHGVYRDWSVEPIMKTFVDGVRTVCLMFTRGYSEIVFYVKR